MKLVLYSKPDCHLCEGLYDKLVQISEPPFELEVRDITTNDTWWHRYQYEIPVLCWVGPGASPADTVEIPIPRCSPRASVAQVARMLQKSHPGNAAQ